MSPKGKYVDSRLATAGSLSALRIGYLSQTGSPDMSVISGPQLHVKAVIRGLQRRGHQIRAFMTQKAGAVWSDDVCCPDWKPARNGFSGRRPFRLIESVVRRTQTELRLPYLNMFDSVRFSDGAYQALLDYHLIYERFGFMGYGGVLTAARLAVPLILEINGDIPKEMELFDVKMSGLQRKASMRITRLTLEAATGIVCVAASLKQRLIEVMGLNPRKIEVILNGADTELFAESHDLNAVREKYGLVPRPTVSFVGSFQPWHGVDLLLDSFQIVQAKMPAAQLLLIGDGRGRAEAERRVLAGKLSGAVRFMGRLQNSQVAEILSVTDVAVAPFPYVTTDIVGSPLKLFEYMAAGCPIVASCAPIHDVIEQDVTGLRVEPADASALAMAQIRLLSDADLRQRLSVKARAIAREQYSWDNTTKQLESFFQRVLTEHASQGHRA